MCLYTGEHVRARQVIPGVQGQRRAVDGVTMEGENIRMLQRLGSGRCRGECAIRVRRTALLLIEMDGEREAAPEGWISDACHFVWSVKGCVIERELK